MMKPTCLFLSLLILTGCSGPLLWFPGGALSGREVPLDLTQPPQAGVIELETRPADPYSVNIGFTLIDGEIYIDPAAERTWYQHMLADPRVRIRFSGQDDVHPAIAEQVDDPAILSRFDPDRIVLRLSPRN